MSPELRPVPTDSALPALERLVREIVGARANVDVQEQRVNSRVYRLQCATNGTIRSFVGKRLEPGVARRNELVARRWLPALGLSDLAPPLLAVAAEPDASAVWHLYRDLGDLALDVARPDFEWVRHAVAAIARLHTRFAGHALIPECRLWGGDLGISFYAASVRDAIAALESLHTRTPRNGRERRSLCDRLLARLAVLLDELGPRAEALARSSGPETLLHGDLTRANVMVGSSEGKSWVRLIDWDHAAVGPVPYDLSTFLYRFPASERSAILRLYEEEVGRVGWRLPSDAELNVAFETAELARLANSVIWPALAAWEDRAGWGFEALEEVERWFEQRTPVLPLADAC